MIKTWTVQFLIQWAESHKRPATYLEELRQVAVTYDDATMTFDTSDPRYAALKRKYGTLRQPPVKTIDVFDAALPEDLLVEFQRKRCQQCSLFVKSDPVKSTIVCQKSPLIQLGRDAKCPVNHWQVVTEDNDGEATDHPET